MSSPTRLALEDMQQQLDEMEEDKDSLSLQLSEMEMELEELLKRLKVKDKVIAAQKKEIADLKIAAAAATPGFPPYASGGIMRGSVKTATTTGPYIKAPEMDEAEAEWITDQFYKSRSK